VGINTEIQSLSPSAIVELFELDATSIGGPLVYWHNGVNELGSDVVWQGNTYTRLPVEANGFEKSSNGTIPRPTLRIANVTGVISATARAYDDLIGAQVTRRKTFVKYLDAVNFASGNPLADPNAAFQDDIWIVDRKASENGIFIEFELAAIFDLAGVKLPRRQFVQNICGWAYRSAECSYSGGAVADTNDVATTILANDVCGKRLASCALRFGETAVLPFGGFPAVGLLR
jgi:lambda family phage minor tail protein L